MAKWRVHPTSGRRCLPSASCKSWQSGEYIQLAVAHFRVVEGCKSWQNGGYIQQSRALYYEKQAVSHGKMVGTAIKRYIPR